MEETYDAYIKSFQPNPLPLGRRSYPEECGSSPEIDLTLQLLKQVHVSIDVDASGSNLKHVKEVDIAVSGGGLKGYFCTGVGYILYMELARQGIKINRISGSSAGAFSAWFMAIGLCTGHWLESYLSCQKLSSQLCMHENYAQVYEWLQHVVPKNSYELCNNRLFISYTVLNAFGVPIQKVKSTYTSNRDIFDACLASSSIPFVTYNYNGGFLRYNGDLVLDGGITKFIPTFEEDLGEVLDEDHGICVNKEYSDSAMSKLSLHGDDVDKGSITSDSYDMSTTDKKTITRRKGRRAQLIIDLSQISYPISLIVNPKDRCIESLSIRGAIMAARFLEGRSNVEGIYWSHSQGFKWYQLQGGFNTIKMSQQNNFNSQVTEQKRESFTDDDGKKAKGVLAVSILYCCGAAVGMGFIVTLHSWFFNANNRVQIRAEL